MPTATRVRSEELQVERLFWDTIESIRADYAMYNFYVERDFVWTVQKQLKRRIQNSGLPFTVYNDYPMERGPRRSKSVDLAVIPLASDSFDIRDGRESAEFVAEFKFEPSRERPNDICLHKLPVTAWKDIQNDVERVHRFVKDGKAKAAAALFVDEYGRHRAKNPDSLSEWMDWGSYDTDSLNVSALYTLL